MTRSLHLACSRSVRGQLIGQEAANPNRILLDVLGHFPCVFTSSPRESMFERGNATVSPSQELLIREQSERLSFGYE
jgi:hypothetical protein